MGMDRNELQNIPFKKLTTPITVTFFSSHCELQNGIKEGCND